MSSNNLYNKDYLLLLNELKNVVPQQLHAYSEWNSTVLRDGALKRKEKEIIAAAVAHLIKSPYSIDIHTRSAKAEGASLEELAEAAFVAVYVESEIPGGLDTADHTNTAVNKWAVEEAGALQQLKKAVMSEGSLSLKLKEVIAAAVSYAIPCPPRIDLHIKKALENGATEKELAEIRFISAAILAEGSYTHIANMMKTYGEEERGIHKS